MDDLQKVTYYDSLSRRFKALYETGKLDTVLFKGTKSLETGHYMYYYHLGDVKVRAKSRLYFALVNYALTGAPVWEYLNV